MIMAKAQRTPIKFHGRVGVQPVGFSPPTRNVRTVAQDFLPIWSGLLDLLPGP